MARQYMWDTSRSKSNVERDETSYTIISVPVTEDENRALIRRAATEGATPLKVAREILVKGLTEGDSESELRR